MSHPPPQHLAAPKSQSSDQTQLPKAVQEEQRLLTLVQKALDRPPPSRVKEDYEAQWVKLRDNLAEAHLPEDRASIIEQMQRVSHLAAARSKHVISRADPANPYFGHMRLRDDDGRDREVFIGKQTHIDGGINIVDWRNAPISRVFYQCGEGDEFCMEIAGREIEGEVRLRRTITVGDAQLQRVGTTQETFVKQPDGSWVDMRDHRPSLRGGAGAAARHAAQQRTAPSATSAREDKHLPEIASLLDREQFNLITRPDSGLIAIQGNAGSGKTTVALHRAAYLAFEDPKRFKPSKMMVVVFNKALANYISHVLPSLGVEGVKVCTYESWARPLRRQLFPSLPDRYNEITPAAVSRFKQHSALLKMISDAARNINPNDNLAEAFDELFTDISWIRQGLREYAPPNAFSDATILSIHDWCSRQSAIRLDDGGPNDDDRPCLDPEDDSLLLYLYQQVRGPLPKARQKTPLQYTHLVVDEAQDFSTLDLAVLLGCTERTAPVTLAGDTAQKIAEHNDFEDWTRLLDLLGFPHIRVSPLHISYRSTAPIMRLAHQVLGPLAPPDPPTTTRDGAPVERFEFSSHGQAFAFMIDTLLNLQRSEPRASIALLTRYPHQADLAFEALNRSDLRWLRRVNDQNFEFSPGIDVTDIRQSKGLEFDYVILLDADPQTFPDQDASRHLLHVGITRAAHQCWLISVGPPTPLLPRWLEAGVAV